MALSIIISDSATATLLATLLMLFQMLFGGLLLNKGTIPSWASWMENVISWSGKFNFIMYILDNV
jgi:hypothetical protein